MKISEVFNKSKCCCSCRHNIRKHDKKRTGIYCECEIDNHYIGFIACFENVCNNYVAEREVNE